MSKQDQSVPVIDLGVKEIFATGIFAPEDHGSFFRVAGYADRMNAGELERVIVYRTVYPREEFMTNCCKLWRWMLPSLDLSLLRKIAERHDV